MIKKFSIYTESDGIMNALRFTLKSLTGLIYNSSFTNVYKRIVGKEEYTTDITIKELQAKDVETINFPRLKLLPWQKWLNNKSRLFVAYVDNLPVGYSWIHYNDYHFVGKFKFKIEENECWIGPSFVRNECRGKGIQKAMTQYRMSQTNNTIVYTSVGISNIASNKCMYRNKFKLIGTVRVITLFGKKIKTVITPNIKDKIIKQ